MAIRVSHHRRFTANHTWHVDWRERQLFVKANPNHADAHAEHAGHGRLHGFYPVPHLHGVVQVGRWTITAYERWPHLGLDHGLLADVIAHADLTQDRTVLDQCLTATFTTYRKAIEASVVRTTLGRTMSKLYGERVTPGGRLDAYYGTDRAWRFGPAALRPSELSHRVLVVNGQHRWLDFDQIVGYLRRRLANDRLEWAALTQGDPTEMNLGWSPSAGGVWFDYDTAGLNALAGEFACFLIYQRLHGAWLTPRYNPRAFRDHPLARTVALDRRPVVDIRVSATELGIDYDHRPSSARLHTMRRYVNEIVEPFARELAVDDVVDWLRPYVVMRLLGVYNVAELESIDVGLSVALLAEALDPATCLWDLVGVPSPVHQP